MEKVPWAKKVQSRPCEEFQACLVRGNFQEGDDFDWAETARKEKLLEKWRRRGDIEWKLKTTDQVLGRGRPGPADPLGLGVTGGLAAPESPYWSEEEEEERWSLPGRGDGDSDSSGGSVKTHIRTPPHITVLEAEVEEQEDMARTPERERVEERLVNKIPTPPPSIVPRTNTLILSQELGETGPLGVVSKTAEQGAVGLSSIVRRNVQRLKLS